MKSFKKLFEIKTNDSTSVNNLIIRRFFLLLFISTFVYLLSYIMFLKSVREIKQTGIKSLKIPNLNHTNQFKTNQSAYCEPILSEVKPFQVEIDGQYYPKSVQLYLNETINFDCLNKSKTIKKILLWNTFFGDRSFTYTLGTYEPFKKHNCPVTSCELLNNKTRLNESDYVLVHVSDLIIPGYRRLHFNVKLCNMMCS